MPRAKVPAPPTLDPEARALIERAATLGFGREGGLSICNACQTFGSIGSARFPHKPDCLKVLAQAYLEAHPAPQE